MSVQPEQSARAGSSGGRTFPRSSCTRRFRAGRGTLAGGIVLVSAAGVAAVLGLVPRTRPSVAGPSGLRTSLSAAARRPLAEQVALAGDPARWSALLADPVTACATGSSDPGQVVALSADRRRDGWLEATVDPECFRDPKAPRPLPDQVDGVPLKAGASLSGPDVLILHKGYTVRLTCRTERHHDGSERSLRFDAWPTDAAFWYVSVAVSAVNGVPVRGYVPITAIVRNGQHVYSVADALPACSAT